MKMYTIVCEAINTCYVGVHSTLSLHQFNCVFCRGTGVPRHSAGGVGTFVRMCVCTYVVRIVCNAHVRVMEAEISITLTMYIAVNTYL